MGRLFLARDIEMARMALREAKTSKIVLGEGQKGTPGRGRDRKCHDRASRSRPLLLPLEPLTSLASSPFFCTSVYINGRGGGCPSQHGVGGEGGRFVMTLSDVFLAVPFLASPFDLHRSTKIATTRPQNMLDLLWLLKDFLVAL